LATASEGGQKRGATPQERYEFYETPEKDGLFYGDRGMHSYHEWKREQDRKSGNAPSAH
jgi:hypothetical protein